MSVLDDPVVRAELAMAWEASNPGETGGIEIGGFILRGRDGKLGVLLWLPGSLDTIDIPDHPNCQIAGLNIVATFHTHPTTGKYGRPEPSPTDINSVRSDTDLKGAEYEGEYVISEEHIYLIDPQGRVGVAGLTKEILGGSTS